MKRVEKIYNINNLSTWTTKLINLAQHQEVACLLDSHNDIQKLNHSSYDVLLAFEPDQIFEFNEQITNQLSHIDDWLFGFITYEYKNHLFDLVSSNQSHIDFPDVMFFIPKKIIFIKQNQLVFSYHTDIENDIEIDFLKLTKYIPEENSSQKNDLKINSLDKEAYIEAVNKMLNHIQMGNIYEANYCMEFTADDVDLSPFDAFLNLNDISKAPMSTFVKYHKKYLLSASPERYLKKIGSKIISQPIKGTAKRGSTLAEDDLLKENLRNDPKERSENVMIVDLVRNDLSITALPNSVKVEQLFGIYTFEQVHQMISTISSEVANDLCWTTIINTTFPMGSMTGAPKKSALQIIDDLEFFRRGLYSGTVGYITPQKDFDFNVVIRSIMYDEANKKMSFAVGSAITINAHPETEYNECLLKAKAMMQVLGFESQTESSNNGGDCRAKK